VHTGGLQFEPTGCWPVLHHKSLLPPAHHPFSKARHPKALVLSPRQFVRDVPICPSRRPDTVLEFPNQQPEEAVSRLPSRARHVKSELSLPKCLTARKRSYQRSLLCRTMHLCSSWASCGLGKPSRAVTRRCRGLRPMRTHPIRHSRSPVCYRLLPPSLFWVSRSGCSPVRSGRCNRCYCRAAFERQATPQYGRRNHARSGSLRRQIGGLAA